MKKLFTLFGLVLGVTAVAQTTVPNPSFENFTDQVVWDSLEEWQTSNSQLYMMGQDPNVWYDDTDPKDGLLSLYMETIFIWNEGTMEDDTMFAYALKGNADGGGFTGIPYTDTVNQFTFWYKCDLMPGDSAVAIIQLSKAGSIYAQAVYKMGGTVSSWTQATVAVPGGETEEPDSLWLGFASSDPFGPGIPDEGSVLEIDLVELQFTTGSMTTPTALTNNSFENINEVVHGSPDDWFTFDFLTLPAFGASYTAESADASSGVASLEITTTPENVANDVPSIATNGEFDFDMGDFIGGTSFNAQPAEMLVDYKYAPAGGGDTSVVWIQSWNDGTGTLVDTFAYYTTTVSSWTTDTISLNFTEAPDSILIVLYSGSNAGSVFKVDNIRFQGGDLGTETLTLADAMSIYPNPANQSTIIRHGEADEIIVMNIAGQRVYSSINISGSTTEVGTSDWPEGIYLVQIKKNGKVETKKLVVTH